MLLYITATVFTTENQDVSEPRLTSKQNVQFEQGIQMASSSINSFSSTT